jgi:hypothetical protein
VSLPEGLLDGMQTSIWRHQSLHRGDGSSVNLNGEKETGPVRLPVDEHRATPAYSVLASHVSARKAEVMAQEVREKPTNRNVCGPGHPVHYDT